jgi:hypothetical protein
MVDVENQEEENLDERAAQEPEGHQSPEGNRQGEEQDWPTNGGPLGCLLGALAGFLLGGFLGTTLLIFERPIALVLTVVLTMGLAIAGWQIGRSIFREYKPAKPRRVKK